MDYVARSDVERLNPARAVLRCVPGVSDVDPFPDHLSVAEIQDGHDRMGITAVEPERELDDLHIGRARRTMNLKRGGPARIRLTRRDDVRSAADPFAALDVLEARLTMLDTEIAQVAAFLPRLFAIESEYQRVVVAAELARRLCPHNAPGADPRDAWAVAPLAAPRP